jgi:CRISPR-associated protein Cas1
VSAGYSPALGFIHTGKLLSFVYDVADLYKADLTIPAAFQAAAQGPQDMERRVRHTCRDLFYRERLLARIVPDLQQLLNITAQDEDDTRWNSDAALPGGLWSPAEEVVAGGVNYAEEELRKMESDDDRADS